MKSASDPCQTRITAYFHIIEEISHIVESHPEVSRLFQDKVEHNEVDNLCPVLQQLLLNARRNAGKVPQQRCHQQIVESHPEVSRLFQDKVEHNEVDNLCPVLQQLLLNARRNAGKVPQQRCHQQIMKKFATSLFIYSGPLAYEFIHRNLSEALPSLRSVQRIVSSEYQSFYEGTFRFDELLTHLQAYNAPLVITIGEDATRLIARVDYDSETDRLVGFVLPCNKNGLPITDSFIATSFEVIDNYFSTAQVAKYAFVYMAQGLCEGVPTFCLACMGSDNKFIFEDILKRWKFIFMECKKRGITVVSFGADGDSRELRARQISTQLNLSPKSPLF